MTEFFPVSSSAHLLLFPELFGWNYLGKSFDVALHLGTLGALAVYLRPQLDELLKTARHPRAASPRQRRLLLALMVATAPAAVIGWLFQEVFEGPLGGLAPMAVMLVVWAVLLDRADRFPVRRASAQELGWLHLVWLGLAQAAALMPGTSRSGATMAAGRSVGLSRAESARFSFLLSMPLVAGAAGYKLLKLLLSPPDWGLLGPSLIGMVAAGASGLVCIRALAAYLERASFRPFVVYRIGLAMFMLAWALAR